MAGEIKQSQLTPPLPPLTYHIGGDLYLPHPAAAGLTGPHLELALNLQPDLERLDARKLSEVRKSIVDIDAAFSEFANLEREAWLANNMTPPSAEFLVKPSGSLQSPIAHHLNQPSFSSTQLKGGETADLTNGCINMVMNNAFEKGKSLIFDDYLRRHETSEGDRVYPSSVKQVNESLIHRMRESMEAKVEIVYGRKAQHRLFDKFFLDVLPLWGELQDIFICLDLETNYANCCSGEKYRRLIFCAAHPQRLYFESLDSTLSVQQDKIISAAAKVARIPYIMDYFQKKRWRKYQLFGNSKAMGVFWSTVIPERSISDPPEESATQSLSYHEDCKDVEIFGAWMYPLKRKPMSNKELRDALPNCLKTAKESTTKQWLEPSDFPHNIRDWWGSQWAMLFRDIPVSGMPDLLKVLRRLGCEILTEEPTLNDAILRLLDYQDHYMKDVPSIPTDHLVYRGLAPFDTVAVECSKCQHQRVDNKALWSVNRPLTYVCRIFRCNSSVCSGKQTDHRTIDSSVPWTRNAPASLTTMTVVYHRIWSNCLQTSASPGIQLPLRVECYCIVCKDDPQLPQGEYRFTDNNPRWTIGDTRPLYLEHERLCVSCRNKGDIYYRRFIPVDPNIPSIITKTLAMFEENIGNRFQPMIKAKILEMIRPSSRTYRPFKKRNENRVDPPQASHPNPKSTSTAASSTQFTSTAESTVIPSTQCLFGGTITADLATCNAVSTIIAQRSSGFIPIEELEARQVVQIADVTKTPQPKKRGRPLGSKDCQPRKKRAKKALEQEIE